MMREITADQDIAYQAARPITTNDVLAFVIGAVGLFYINVVGQLYLSEILLAFLAPLLWARAGRALLRNIHARRIMVLGAVWLFGQVLTDFFRQTPLADLARGWAGITVLLVCFSSLYLLLGNNLRRIQICLWGYALGGLVAPFIQPSVLFKAEPWKFGFGGPVILLALLFIIRAGRGQLKKMGKWAWLLLLIGALSFYLNTRSLGGMVILTGVVLWLRTSPFAGNLWRHLGLKKILVIGLLLVGTVWGLLAGYAYAAEQGLFGQDVRSKFEMQYAGSVLSLIVGGRSEILASSRAIWDSPLIGHGSWARDMKYRLYLWELPDLGYQRNVDQLEAYIYGIDLIPAHSHLTQAWVWAGIVGAVFWVWVLIYVGRRFLRANMAPNALYPLVIYFCIAGVWDILFSPYGSAMRIIWALRFVVFLFAVRPARDESIHRNHFLQPVHVS